MVKDGSLVRANPQIRGFEANENVIEEKTNDDNQ